MRSLVSRTTGLVDFVMSMALLDVKPTSCRVVQHTISMVVASGRCVLLARRSFGYSWLFDFMFVGGDVGHAV